MTEAPVDITDRFTTIGPGRLILLVGPSGVGKDTLMRYAKSACADDPDIIFVRRVITRAASDSEDNEEVNDAEFAGRLSKGEFAIDWEAHGHRYALPSPIQSDIRAGRTVIANVSRTVVAALRRDYASVVVVAVTAPPDVLAQRLTSRGRRSDGQYEQRISRTANEADVAPDSTIDNTGCPERHAGELVRILRRRVSEL